MVLALVKELKKLDITEEKAFKLIFNDFWRKNPSKDNWKKVFQEVFNITLENFYLSLKNYTNDITSVLPSGSLKLENIFPPPPPPPPKSDTSSPVVKVSGYTSHSAPATSNVFVLKEVTTNIYWDCINREGNDGKTYEESIAACTGITEEFSKGDIVTFGHSKEEYEIREAKVLKKSESGKIQDGYIYMEKEWAIRVLYKGTEFKITQRPFDIILSGDGNIQGIVLKKAVGFIISPGMYVTADR